MSRLANGQNTRNGYSSVEIATMSLEQLRLVSDLQLSDRELADVIQAIHTGGNDGVDVETEDAAQPDLRQECLMCQQAGQVGSEQCLACCGGGTPEEVHDLLLQWAEWYKQYQKWAATASQRRTANCGHSFAASCPQ